VNFNLLQNVTLFRSRQRGANFGNPGTPANTSSDYTVPTYVTDMLNEGYQEFLSRTKDYPLAPVQCWFKSVANAQVYPLNPLPANPTGFANPKAMSCYEGSYFQGSAGGFFPPGIGSVVEYRIDFVSVDRFRYASGQYQRRNSWSGPRPYVAMQRWGQPFVDILPATATTGDYMYFFVCPDPLGSPVSVPAQLGGKLVNPSDEPLIDRQYHMALVEYALSQLLPALGRQQEADAAEKRFEKYVNDALMFGATRLSGDPEQRVIDTWQPTGLPF
jgi:hypothetical protein